MVRVERIPFRGWDNCYQMTNGKVKLIVTADIGPRIIHFGFADGPNELAELSEDSGQTGGSEFRFYGGHRLWHAPEAMPRSYVPDNEPVQVAQDDQGLSLVAITEKNTHIQKALDIVLVRDKAQVQIIHRLINRGLWPVELAPWALTMCAQGGVGIAPLPSAGDHAANLLPRTSVTLWSYTCMADLRWTWGDQLIMLRQDITRDSPQKAGLFVDSGWVAFAKEGHLLLKTFASDTRQVYPDRGCNVELFTNQYFLEIETLGPLITLEPEAAVEHVEHWHLLDGVPEPQSEADTVAYVFPRIQAILERI